MKKIITTNTHGAQCVYEIEPDSGLPIHNRLFALEDANEPERVVNLTGEEMTDLANQWLAYAKSAGMPNDPKLSHAGRKSGIASQPKEQNAKS